MLNSLHSNLLVAVSLCYVTGVILSFYFSSFPPAPFYLIAAALIFGFLYKMKSKYSFLFLFVLFILIGIKFGTAAMHPEMQEHHISFCIDEKQDAVVIGKVLRIYGYTGKRTAFDLESNYLRFQDTAFKRVAGKVRLSMRDVFPHSIFPGDTIVARVLLYPPARRKIEGSFDYPGFLAQSDIYTLGRVTSPLHLDKLPNTTTYFSVSTSTERARETINRFIDANLHGDTAGIYKALLTGDRSSISQETLEKFKRAGVLHLLAISGLHISLLGILFYSLFFWLLRRSTFIILRINVKKAAILLSITPLLFYTMLAGGKIPVLRAFVMSALVITAVCTNKKHSMSAIIACAAFAILLVNPVALFTPSYQLTFAAVISIFIFSPWFNHWMQYDRVTATSVYIRAPMQWLIAGFGVSLAALLGTAPLLLFHFNQLSIMSVAANLIIEPILCLWSLVVGFLAIPLIYFTPILAKSFFQLGGEGVELAITIVSHLSSIPYSSLFLPTPSIVLITVYYCIFLLILPRSAAAKTLVSPVLCSAVITLFLFFYPPSQLVAQKQQHSKVTFLGIGQGSSTHLSLPGGKNILIDGGAMSSPDYDVGRRRIAPYLWHKGVRKLDHVVITHPDSDHYNGIGFLLRAFDVDNLWISTRKNVGESWFELLKLAREKSVNIITAETEAYVYKDGVCELRILVNTAHFNTGKNNGLVLKFTHDQSSVLFPGDIPSAVEHQLIQRGINVKSDVLLAAHHGSSTSNSPQFLDSVQPRQIIVSSDKSRRKHFPAQSLVDFANKQGIGLYLLGETGSVQGVMQKGGYELHTPHAEKFL